MMWRSDHLPLLYQRPQTCLHPRGAYLVTAFATLPRCAEERLSETCWRRPIAVLIWHYWTSRRCRTNAQSRCSQNSNAWISSSVIQVQSGHIFLVNLPCSSASESSASDQSSPSPTAKIVSPSKDPRGWVIGGFRLGSLEPDCIGAYAWSVNEVDAAPPGDTALS